MRGDQDVEGDSFDLIRESGQISANVGRQKLTLQGAQKR